MEREPAPIPAERLAELRKELLVRFLAGEQFWNGNSNAVHGAAGMLDGERQTAVYRLLGDGLVQWRTPRGMIDIADWSLTDKGRAEAEQLGYHIV